MRNLTQLCAMQEHDLLLRNVPSPSSSGGGGDGGSLTPCGVRNRGCLIPGPRGSKVCVIMTCLR